MPGLNGTGPQGQGSGTGRKQGRCRTEEAVQTSTTQNSSRQGFRIRFQADNSEDFAGRGRRRRKHLGGQGMNRGRH